MTRTILAVALLLSAATMSACGGSGSGGDGDGDGDTVDLATYLTDVCTALTDYQADVQDAQGTFGQVDTPSRRKEALVTFFGAAVEVTATMATRLEQAGVPDIDNGETVATAVSGSFRQTVSVYEAAVADARALPTGDQAAFRQATKQLLDDVNGAESTATTGLDGLQSPEIEAMAGEVAACQGL